MNAVCAQNVDIPSRKLLFSKKLFQDSSPDLNVLYPFHSNLRNLLPFNDLSNHDDVVGVGGEDDEDLNPYSSDHFRMYEFKVRRCTRSRSHDWTDCPFAHPGEKARRRDPRKFHYSGTVCPEFRRGGCCRGDSCEFAHGVFECWLHPSRYRTEACKDGKNCERKICFFAHSPRQLRILPEVSCGSVSNKHGNCCCLAHNSMISSPTSTLLGMSHMSPPSSPPLSPVKHRPPVSGVSAIRCNDRLSKLRPGIMSYRDVLTELMSSLEAVNFNEAAAADYYREINKNNTIPWIDISSLHEDQLILSPSTPNGNVVFNGDCSSNNTLLNNNYNNNNYKDGADNKNNDNGGHGGGDGGGDPDLGWVNELLM